MSLKKAENGNFRAQMESFQWFKHPKCDVKNFAWIKFRESAIPNVIASFNFAKMAKIAKFNLAKIYLIIVCIMDQVLYILVTFYAFCTAGFYKMKDDFHS